MLSTPDDGFFEYDLTKVDKDGDGNIHKENDTIVIILIYYKYKWGVAFYDLV